MYRSAGKEFKAMYAHGLLKIVKREEPKSRQQKNDIRHITDLPEEKDWRDDGIISAVRNQGGCASCWAFAASKFLNTSLICEEYKSIVIHEKI